MPEIFALDAELARAAVADGTSRYFADRRLRVKPFVDRHFSLRGTLRLHRVAVGWDIAKAPLNLTLAAPQLGARLAAMAADRMGAARVASALRRPLLLQTRVAQEIVWLINVELLELPFRQGERACARDALAETILQTPRLDAAMTAALAEIGRRGDDPAFRDRLLEAMAEYTVSRAAAAEITTGLLSLGAGAATVNKLTPGAATLGPALAAIMAHQAAVASFPLGGWLGGVWYGLFPMAPSAGLVATTTGGLMLAAASLAAFAGIISDPIQRALGLHRARLLRLIGVLEKQVSDPSAPGFRVHDHYVARLLDLFDIVGAAVRLARI
jgi:hypothetical protein